MLTSVILQEEHFELNQNKHFSRKPNFTSISIKYFNFSTIYDLFKY